MNNRAVRLLISWAIIVFMCALVMPAFAQEATTDPTLIDPAQVVRDGNIVISEFLVGAITGALIGGGGVLVSLRGLIKFVSQNEPLKMAIERLYLSSPPITQERLRVGATTANEFGKLADELTDGKMPQRE